MKKVKAETMVAPPPPPAPEIAGTAAHVRAVADGQARLAARRQRDALPHRIETRRLVLRAPIRGDVPDLVRFANNAAIARVLSRLPHPYTRADGVGFVEIMSQRADERPYAITLDGHLIGVVGFSYSPTGEPPELGYWLGQPHWGQGYMSEAVRGLLDAAFATGLYARIKSRALKSNSASLRVLDKVGFRVDREGTDDAGTLAGQPIVFLTLDRPRWT
jgi:RimJ/RimL family protein N-acetyltransferase